jgi:hypothetical protein
MASRAPTTRVIDGGCTRSWAASSPALIAPCRRSVDIAERCVSVTDVSTRWPRSRRENRMTAIRSSWASAAASRIGSGTILSLTQDLPRSRC